LDSPETPKSFTGETLKTVKINSESVVFKVEKMAENIAKIDEKIRELKRKKKTAENQQMIKACNAYLRSLNSSLKESGIQVKRIDEVLGFLLEQETNGKWVSKWLAKKRAEK
jgi:hypothetical protein